MGHSNSREENEIINYVEQHSNYSRPEITQWYEKFQKQYPSGYLTKSQFMNFFATIGGAREFTEHNFRAMDLNHDGKINFEEFMISLSIRCRGTLTEKLKWLFCLFDVNADGYITRSEMMSVMTSLYQSVNMHGGTAKECTEKLFQDLDADKDELITFNEFEELAKKDPKLIETISQYGKGA